jgi:predicted nucleic acid-binding Zn ribbon protein|tara:strand:+ start:1138 stop:1341 length:204 start_codon:yes stop_codon:yes gene_type:complete
MSDARLENCPECEGKVRRLVSGGSGLIFKGSGFYLTDYAKKDSPGKSKDLPKPEKKKKKPEKESAKP